MTTAAAEARTTGRAGKVLAAAEGLLLKHGYAGVTMSAVAQKAHVGKGTPYLYWRTKEDLFLALATGHLADLLDDVASQVRDDPALAVADRLVPVLTDAWLKHPLVRALQTSDADVLGALLDDPRTHAIVAENGADAVLRRLLPIWRDHHTIGTNWTSEEQAAALELVLFGYFASQNRGIAISSAADRSHVLRLALSAVLDTRQPDPEDGDALAEAVGRTLRAHAQQLRATQV